MRSPLALPLGDDWRDTLAELARRQGWPSSMDDPSRLGARVAELSAAYNVGDATKLRGAAALSARLGFSFPRDVPKTAGAVRELVSTRTLALAPERPLRVLDLGAGLGASTWGVARAFEACGCGPEGRIEAQFVDEDGEALRVAEQLARLRQGQGGPELALRTRRAGAVRGAREAGGGFDLVLLGQVLSEIVAASEEETLRRQREVVDAALAATAPHGSVVIVEPALRERTRRLHALRDELLSSSGGAVRVFAPCLHQAPCPARADPSAWCHEDLEVDLPGWLVPVAAAAGLRWQGLTFSYLVLRKDGRDLRKAWPAGDRLLRVVSEPIVTKGKREIFVCGELGGEGGLGVARARVVRLDRDESDANAPFDGLARGDVFSTTPPIDPARPRVGRETRVESRTAGASLVLGVDRDAHTR